MHVEMKISTFTVSLCSGAVNFMDSLNECCQVTTVVSANHGEFLLTCSELS